MSFTSQRSFAGQQAFRASSLSSFAPVSESEMNWRPTSIGQSAVGSRCWPCGMPGSAVPGKDESSKPSDRMPAQINVRMKNARKATGQSVSDKFPVNGLQMMVTPDDSTRYENQVFAEPSAPRQPESPEVESLRSLLKANLPSEKASPALLQRIRSRMHENKE